MSFVRVARHLLSQGMHSKPHFSSIVAPQRRTGIDVRARQFIRLAEIFGKEAKERRAAELKSDIERGYAQDFKEIRASEIESYSQAQPMLTPAKNAKTFPDFEVKTLFNEASSSTRISGGKPTLMIFAFRAFAQEMVDSWHHPFVQEFQGDIHDGRLSSYEINVSDSWFISAMQSSVLWSLLSKVESSDRPEMANHILYSFVNLEDVRKDLNMRNKFLAYVFLVDSEGLVRWKGQGKGGKNELASLFKCTKNLIEEFENPGH